MTSPAHGTLRFVHGWAFDASVWLALREALHALLPGWRHEVHDAGYFGTPAAANPADTLADPRRAAEAEPVIAIGHSLGALTLLTGPAPGCAGLVMINGFTRFSAHDSFPDGVPARVLDRMLARLGRDPSATVSEFRARCLASSAPRHLDVSRLTADLQRLRDEDGRSALLRCTYPIRLLAGQDDPIATPAMTRAAGIADTHWHPDGHLLPLTAAQWCAQRIRDFALVAAARAGTSTDRAPTSQEKSR